MTPDIPGWKDKILLTPGPLTTSRSVKQAMLQDLGSRDSAFIDRVREIREGLVAVAQARPEEYTAIPMQGSGTFAIESVFASTAPPDAKVLIAINGAYGQRMVRICSMLGIDTVPLEFLEQEAIDAEAVREVLEGDGTITSLAVVHCETTTGIFNPVRALGAVAHERGVSYIVDAMSSFGAVPLDLADCHVDFLVSSANKCIEGVPGFGFVIARRSALERAEGWARSLSLDLLGQWRGLEANGQFRFTPPTHALLAFHQALRELEEEGGVAGRARRYQENHQILLAGMSALGFKTYLPPDRQGYIITSFRYPEHPRWNFDVFYAQLSERDYVIYPGKVSDADCFRIGNIGRVFPADIHGLLAAVRDVRDDMGVAIPVPAT